MVTNFAVEIAIYNFDLFHTALTVSLNVKYPPFLTPLLSPLQINPLLPTFYCYNIEGQCTSVIKGFFFSECVSWEKDGVWCQPVCRSPTPGHIRVVQQPMYIIIHSIRIYQIRMVHVYYQTLLKMKK